MPCLRSQHKVGAGILMLDAKLGKCSEMSHGRKEQGMGRKVGTRLQALPKRKSAAQRSVQNLCTCVQAPLVRMDGSAV